MVTRIIRRVGVLSMAKIYGVLAAGMGLLIGLVFAAISTLGAGLVGTEPPFMAGMFGVGAIVILPIVYGLIGLVSGAIGAALYNVFAGIVGGLQIDVE